MLSEDKSDGAVSEIGGRVEETVVLGFSDVRKVGCKKVNTQMITDNTDIIMRLILEKDRKLLLEANNLLSCISLRDTLAFE